MFLLTSAQGSWGSLGYTYDGVGNRQKETNGGETLYSYQANKLLATTGAKQYAFGYDTNGNTITEGAKQYIYNQNQRLIKVTELSGEQTIAKGEYVYNGNGQRVKKTVNGQTTLFFYDQHGRLVSEAGATTADYLYLNGNPLAKAEGVNIYHYHNDHLGTPQRMTDNLKQVVWIGEFKPFGEAMSVSGTVTNNLRFPGQYNDNESVLNYNYFRDYNTQIGRYEEADPIGLQGGINIFTYVANNALIRSDINGLLHGGPNAGIRTPPPPEIRKPRPPRPNYPCIGGCHPPAKPSCLKCDFGKLYHCFDIHLDPGNAVPCTNCFIQMLAGKYNHELCDECLAGIMADIPECISESCEKGAVAISSG